MVAEARIACQRVPTFALSAKQTHVYIPARGSSGMAGGSGCSVRAGQIELSPKSL